MNDYKYIRRHMIRSNQRSHLRSLTAHNYTFKHFACYSISKIIFTKIYGKSLAKINLPHQLRMTHALGLELLVLCTKHFMRTLAEYTSDSVSGGVSIYWYLRPLMFVVQRNIIKTYSYLVTSILAFTCTLTCLGRDKWPPFPRQHFQMHCFNNNI